MAPLLSCSETYYCIIIDLHVLISEQYNDEDDEDEDVITQCQLLSVVTFVRPTAQIYSCLFQGTPEYKRAGKLIDILVMRDENLVPSFYDALIESGQQHVARIVGYKGLCCLSPLIRSFISQKLIF